MLKIFPLKLGHINVEGKYAIILATVLANQSFSKITSAISSVNIRGLPAVIAYNPHSEKALNVIGGACCSQVEKCKWKAGDSS